MFNRLKNRDVCKTLTSHPFQMKHLPRSSPHLVHHETKRFHLTQQHTMKQFWINTFISPTRCYYKRFKVAICTKPTTLKLENSRKMLEIVFLCTLNMINFKRLALIATEMQSNETKCFGSIPSPHQVHSCAIILVLDQYSFLQQHLVGEVKVLIQNFFVSSCTTCR